jgi:hypothetical protein
MDVCQACQLMNLYMELWDDDMYIPIRRLRRVIQHLGLGSAAFAAAVLDGDGGRGGGGSSRILALVVLLHGVAMVTLSVVCVRARRPRRCRIARAVARAWLAPFLLLAMAGLLRETAAKKIITPRRREQWSHQVCVFILKKKLKV